MLDRREEPVRWRSILALWALPLLASGGGLPGTGTVAAAAEPDAKAERSAGVVCHVKVLSDKVEDVSSMDAWKRSFLKAGMTDRQKALAAWETVVKFQHRQPAIGVAPQRFG